MQLDLPFQPSQCHALLTMGKMSFVGIRIYYIDKECIIQAHGFIISSPLHFPDHRKPIKRSSKMSKVCGFGAGIQLLKTNTSPTFSIASYPSPIQCKTDNQIHKQKSESHIQSVSRVPPSQIHIQSTSGIPRRQAVSFLGLSLLLNLSQPAQAKDIPLFGIKKKLEKVEQQLVEEAQKVEQEVAQEAQILVKEGEQEAEKVTEKVKEAAIGLEEKAGLFQGPNGSFAQAGIVAGAELLGVLLASSVVNSIVGPEPSK